MRVKILFGRGPVVTRRKRKNSRMAQLAASILTLTAISCFVLALWRVGMDLKFASDFVFTVGLLSHWQVWMAAAGIAQYLCFRLTRYVRDAQELPVSTPAAVETSAANI